MAPPDQANQVGSVSKHEPHFPVSMGIEGPEEEAQIQRGLRARAPRLADSPFPMLAFDRTSGAILEVNQAAVRAFGWSREELLACVVSDVFPPMGTAQAAFKRSWATHWSGPWSVRRKDGGTFFAEVGMMEEHTEDRSSMLLMVTPWHAASRATGGAPHGAGEGPLDA